MIKALTVGMMCLALVSCAHGGKKFGLGANEKSIVQQQAASGDLFRHRLATEYIVLTQKAEEKKNKERAKIYQEKSYVAINGNAKLPYWGDRNVPESYRSEVRKAFRDAKSIVTQEMKVRYPKLSAAVYASFDCWMDEIEDDSHAHCAVSCRNSFYNNLNAIVSRPSEDGVPQSNVVEETIEKAQENESDSYVDEVVEEALADIDPLSDDVVQAIELEAQAATPVVVVKEVPVAVVIDEAAVETGIASVKPVRITPQKAAPLVENIADVEASYQAPGRPENAVEDYVLFRFDVENVGPNGERQIAEMVQAYPNAHYYLHGYTDRAGPKPYNFKLSLKRAENIKKQLLKAGVADSHIEVLAHGEKPADGSQQSEYQPAHRRVDVFLKQINQ